MWPEMDGWRLVVAGSWTGGDYILLTGHSVDSYQRTNNCISCILP